MRIPIGLTAVVISAALLGVSPSWAQGNTSGATVIATPVPPHPTPGIPPYMEAWAGLGATNSFFGGWVGGVAALSPHRNVWETGFVIRGEAVIGQYDAGTNVDDVLFHGASLMLGYRQVIGDGLLTGYVGANYETHDSDDRFATIRGTEAGFRALVEYYTRIMPSWDFYGQASYSTAFDTTFLFARSGVQLANTIWAGPETAYFQNESDYRENRLGGFVRFEQGFFGNGITLSGGWVNALRSRDEDGWYANLSIDFQFR